MLRTISAALLTLLAVATPAVERVNHAGRLLPALPTVTTPLLFNDSTGAADAVLAAMQIFPVDNAWNEDISARPLLGNSSAMTTRVANDLTSDGLRCFFEMNFVLVPDNQPLVAIAFLDYPDESDPSPYPIPSNWPIETWPRETGAQTLAQWQESAVAGDRHGIIVRPGNGGLFETWQTRRVGTAWQASNGAYFNLASNALRTADWTSADAAGLAMFPALVRYDEVQRGVVEHALRLIVKRTRSAYIYPASHKASSLTDADLPAMGQRFRLKSSFAIPTTWTAESQAVAVALKRYGAIVADNGSFFSVSVTPDDRWPSGCFNNLTGLVPDNFEVIASTGASEGPRSASRPVADAGGDQVLAAGLFSTALGGSVTGTATSIAWSAYPGNPGTVTFGNAAAPGSTATFSAPGAYTLLLSAGNPAYWTSYDAVSITVSAAGANPAPVLDGAAPSGALQGAAATTVTLSGSAFMAGSTVTWSGQADLSPSSWTSTSLTVLIPASYLSTAGSAQVRVVNPGPGGGPSAPSTFTVSASGSGGGGGGSSSGGGGGGCGAASGLAALLTLVLGLYGRLDRR
ncbi:MAG: IPT/TIG domain-containing protein [Planctomycetes bacterium]|nr:IPT/TIG domain-containing protein [Planctomycetota bacterium]